MRKKIEIIFPIPVNFPSGFEQKLARLIDTICNEYEYQHPERVMWPSGFGSKITYMPITPEEEKERGIEFDDSIFCIEVSERKKFQIES